MIGTSLPPGIYRISSWRHYDGYDWLLTLTKDATITNVVPLRRINRRKSQREYNNGAGSWMIMIEGEKFGLSTKGKFDFSPTKTLDD